MQNITSITELRNAIQLLEAEQAYKGKLLKEQFFLTYDSLKRVNILGTALKEIARSSNLTDNILSTMVGLGTGYLSKKIVVGASGNIIRKLIGSFLQLGITNVVAQHPDSVKSIGQLIFQYFSPKRKQILKSLINKQLQLPFYVKASIFLVGLFVFFAILYIAQSIIVPLIFSFIIAVLLHPVVNFIVKIGINRIIAIVITLFLTFIVIAGFVAILFSQVSRFSESWPILVDKFTAIINQSITWASGYFHIDPKNIHEWIIKTKGEILNTSSAAIGQTLITVGNAVMVLFLVPVYIFIILFYQPLLLDFIHKLFGERNRSQAIEIVTQTKTLIQRYLKGLVIEGIMVAIMDSAALLILGIDYAIMIGIIGALLNVIPYIGGLVAVALPMMVAVVSKSSPWTPLYVMGLYYIIQLIDNNYIVPIIVASKVKINALFSIIAILAGNALWGISGMFLSVPLLAIIKLIFDHIEPLKPWGFLLGDTMPSLLKIKPIIKKIKKELT